jgi:hypothetical protein
MSGTWDFDNQSGASEAPDAQSESQPGASMRMMGIMHRRWIHRKAQQRAWSHVTIPEGGGRRLDPAVRQPMEGQLGADLSSVEVHTSGDSERAATRLGARAFTVENHIHFNAGEFAPGSREGDRLLAHELAHVVQGQQSGIRRKAGTEPLAEGEEGEAGEAASSEAGEAAAPEAGEAAMADTGEAAMADTGEAAAPGAEAAEGPGVDEGKMEESGAEQVSDPEDASEKDADHAADKVVGALHDEGDEGTKKEDGAKPAVGAAGAPVARKIFRKPTRDVQPSNRGKQQDADKLDTFLADYDAAMVPGPYTRQREAAWSKKMDARPEKADPGKAKRLDDAKARGKNAIAMADKMCLDLLGGPCNQTLKALLVEIKSPKPPTADDAKKRRAEACNFELRQWIEEYRKNPPPNPAPNPAAGQAMELARFIGLVDGQINLLKGAAIKDPVYDKKGAPPDKKDDGAHPDKKDGAARPNAAVDPVGALRSFIEEGKGWAEIKKEYAKDEAQMTAMFQLRRNTIDKLIKSVCDKHDCKSEANGSANLTSDYDLSLTPNGPDGNPAEAVAEFNELFRAAWGLEAGTVFDTNVYDKGEAMDTKAGKQGDPKLKELESSKEFKEKNDAIQDVAALVKVRKYMPSEDEWSLYKSKLLNSAPPNQQQELYGRLTQAETQYEQAQLKLKARVALIYHGPLDAQLEDVPDDVLLEAANLEYAEALKEVQKARNERAAALSKLKEKPGDETLAKVVEEKDIEIRQAMAKSLDFANEAYNSEGALLDVVGNQQGAFAKMGDGAAAKQDLSPQELLSSFNEQFGDALKDLEHYGHPSNEDAAAEKQGGAAAHEAGEKKRFVKAMVQVSKYVLRMVSAGEQICGSPGAKAPSADLRKEMQRLKTACESLKELRADPAVFDAKQADVPGMVNSNAGKQRPHAQEHDPKEPIKLQDYGIEIESLEAFRGLLLKINLDVNEVARAKPEIGQAQPKKD